MLNNDPEEHLDEISISPTGRHFTAETDTLWTVEDVAGYFKLQPETIRSMARRGELPAIKLGKVWRFQKTAICSLLANLV